MKNPKVANADKLGCSFVARQIVVIPIRNGFRIRVDWDRYFSMNKAMKKGHVGEWALQIATAVLNWTQVMTKMSVQQI